MPSGGSWWPGGVTLVALLVLLAELVAGQSDSITVTAPTSNDEVNAGQEVQVAFETDSSVTGPYDVDLYRGDTKVHAWCNVSEGCDVTGGILNVDIPSSVTLGDGYKVMVTDRDTGLHGTSEVFEVLDDAEVESTEEPGIVVDEQVVGEQGAVGHMNAAMFVVAIVVGVVLVAVVGALCIRRSRALKRKKKRTKVVDNTDMRRSNGDVEGGGHRSGHNRGSHHNVQSGPEWRGHNGGMPDSAQDTLSPTDRRSYQSSGTIHPYSEHPDSDGRFSYSRSHGDPRSREHSRERDYGPRMSGSTPLKARDGPRMMSTTPSKDRFASAPGRFEDSEDPDVGMGPRMYTSSPINGGPRGPRMYSPSMGASWDSHGRLAPRMHATTPSRQRANSGRERDRFTPENRRVGPRMTPTRDALVTSRSRSVGRDRRPRHYSKDASPTRADVPQVPPSQRPYSHGRSPEPRRRSRSQGRPHGYRRSQSVEARHDRTSPPEEWEQEVHRRMAARGASDMRSEEGSEDRRGHATDPPRRSKSMTMIRDMDDPDALQTGAIPSYRETQELEARLGSDGGSSVGTLSPGRHRFYRSGLADAPRTGHDVSWEELRWRHVVVQNGHKKEQDKYRSRRVTATPSEMSSVDSLSLMSGTTGGGGGSRANRGPPPPYRFSPRSLPMSPSSETSRDTHKRSFPRISKSSSTVEVIPRSSSGASSSGQTRAVHARAAARDAQLSAERALAAAAAASRAADAAAQAATEAEAEADAELGIVSDKPSFTADSTSGQSERSPVKQRKKGPSKGFGSGSKTNGDAKKARSSRSGGKSSGVATTAGASERTQRQKKTGVSPRNRSRAWAPYEEQEAAAKAEAEAAQARTLANVMLNGGILGESAAASVGDTDGGNGNAAVGNGIIRDTAAGDGNTETNSGQGQTTAATGADTAGGSRLAGGITTATPPRAPRSQEKGGLYSSERGAAGVGMRRQGSFDNDSDYSVGMEQSSFYPSATPNAGIPSPLRHLPHAVDGEETMPKILSKRRHVATLSPSFTPSPSVAPSPAVESDKVSSGATPAAHGFNTPAPASTVVGAVDDVSSKTEEA